MPNFHFCLFDEDDCIIDAVDVVLPDEESARARAETILVQFPDVEYLRRTLVRVRWSEVTSEQRGRAPGRLRARLDGRRRAN